MWTFDYVLGFGMVILVCSRPAVEARASYCGKELADALELLCNSTYYTPTPTRQERSLIGNRRKMPVLSVLQRQRREISQQLSNGIVEECCKNTCSIQQLRAYCG